MPTTTARSTNHNTHDNTPSSHFSDSYLSIVPLLKSGMNPAAICAKLSIPKTTVQYHLSKLKAEGRIVKVGYGTWEWVDLPESTEKEVRTSSHVAIHNTPQQVRTRTQSQLTRFQQDAVRTHGIVTTWSVPKALRNWNNEKRAQYLTAHQIPYKHLNIGGSGQRIIIKNRKVWLTNPSVIIYDKSSYFAEEALKAKNLSLATHLSIIKHVERLLHTDFRTGSDYKFKVSRQHHALIYNALAKQYNEAGEKLEVRTAKGVWLIIDDSYNMNELETVHPSTAMTDNDKVKGFFNGLKDIPAQQGAPSYTPGFVLEMMNGIQQNQMMFAENIESHITAIRDLGTGVREMTAQLKAGRR